MMSMKNVKKIIVSLLIVFLLLFIAFQIFAKKEYEISYDVDGYHIVESYHKHFNYYSFVFSKEDKTFYSLIDNQYFFAKKIVSKVEEISDGNETCIMPSSLKVRFDYLCRNEEGQISKYLLSTKIKDKMSITKHEEKISFQEGKIDIYDSLEDTIFLWNYKGFNVITPSSIEQVSIFSKDVYQPHFLARVQDYLIIPDYDKEYFFERFYLLDMKSKKVHSVLLPEKIYFDSRILGVYNSSLYFVDKHEEKEWMFDVDKKKLQRVDNGSMGKVYRYGFEDVSMNKLLYQNVIFEGTSIVDYENKEESFYEVWDKYSKKIKNENVKEVVFKKSQRVYYLVGDRLYSFSEEEGERLLLQNFEWNFNSSHVIFVL